jgi:geranylgeranyl pyrophosphate synthase
MQLPVLNIPRPVPIERQRQPQANIPQSRVDRERMKLQARAYVREHQPTPPLSFEELREHTDRFMKQFEHDPLHRDFAVVLLNGEVWRDQLATVPYERRLLLLPKCLRVEAKCPAPFDDFGLLCKSCGLCSIQELQAEAERLGYAVLCAEGSALVMAIIQTGKIDAIVGVSCLSVLEKAFPYMESAAIPGVAIPLLQDDCVDTSVDTDWVWDMIHLTSDDRTYRMDLDKLRREVDGWFAPESLDKLMGRALSQTEQIARSWLTKDGKRWRPFLSACTYRALSQDSNAPFPDDLKRVAIAVECFHKASLIHDDIEDGDERRYNQKTLHAEHGIPVALNAGDLLLGEGYRLLAECEAEPRIRAELLRAAAKGHSTLCLGQGAELSWARDPQPLSSIQVLDIFRQKTAPAFEVALRLGALLGGADDEVFDVLARYSEALGIAYQVRDDIEDLDGEDAPNDLQGLRPSLPLALALERTHGDALKMIEAAWARSGGLNAGVRHIIAECGAEERCQGLLESYKEEAIRSLAALENASLKGLLRRVISKIFGVEIKGWCSEFETRNAASRESSAATVG